MEPGEECTLDMLAARQAMADLVHGYARFVRRGTSDLAADLFAPDGTFEVRQGHPDKPEFSSHVVIRGREQLRDYLHKPEGSNHPIPLIHNLMIDIDGDTAAGNCVMEGQMSAGPGRVFGEYRDTFVRLDGRWFFASRIFTIYDVS